MAKINNLRFKHLIFIVVIVIVAIIGVRFLFSSYAAIPPNVTVNQAIAPATNLTAVNVNPTQVLLSWTASTNAAVNSYAIYQGTTLVGTTNGLTTAYLDKNLTPSTSYSYTVLPKVNGAYGGPTNTITVSTHGSPTTISSCGTIITTPGDYVLASNLTKAAGVTCITIQNTNNVSLNCQNNSITIPIDGGYALNINNTSNFVVDNCTFLFTGAPFSQTVIQSNNNTNGSFVNNTLGTQQSSSPGYLLGANSINDTNVNYLNNTIYAGFIEANSNGDTVNNNTITCWVYPSCFSEIQIAGLNDTVAYNTIDGKGGTSSTGNSYGSDDGITFGNNGPTTDNLRIEYNNISNEFDDGIESSGLITNSTISYNSMDNTDRGFGSWFYSSLSGNSFNYNKVINSAWLFWFEILKGLPTGQSVAYFQNNNFIGNSFSQPSSLAGQTIAHINLTGLPSSELVAGNNLITGNYFRTDTLNSGVNPSPTGIIVDGGNNVCTTNYAIVCTPSPIPTMPVNVAAANDGTNGAFVSWVPSVDPNGPGLAGYNVFRNGTKINPSVITQTSYADTAPLSGANTYTVQAVDTAGTPSKMSAGAVVNGTQTPPPSVPTNLTATAPSSTTISLSWNPSTDTGGPGLAGYNVFNSSGTQINPGTLTSTSFTVTSLTPSTSYSFYVVAVDTAGNKSANSNVASATTPATPLPTTPTNLSASSVTSNSVTLSWSPSTDTGGPGIVGYNVYRGGVLLTPKPNAATSFTDNSVLASSTYSYTVSAEDNVGTMSSQSAAIIVNTPSAADTIPPSAPTNLTATVKAYNDVTLSWTASTDNVGVKGYYVVRNGVTIAQTTSPSYNDTSVNASTSYSYYVLAFDAASNVSPSSNVVSIVTPNPPDTSPPTQPTNLVASVISSSQINLIWNASTDNIGVAGYHVYRNGSLLTNVTTTSFGDSGLNAATTYSYYVVAYDGAGNTSAPSLTVSATTQSPNLNNGSISGVIKSSSTGLPVSGALITVTISGTIQTYSSTSTGSYLIPNLPAGTYQLRYSAGGYKASSVTVSLSSSQSLTQNITLIKNGKK